MRVHRFYVEDMSNKWGPIELKNTLWIHDPALLNQWLKVFRFRESQEVILFNDDTERLYKITSIESAQSVRLDLITELERHLPSYHRYLFWSLLKKDKNEWIVQKATELGATNLVPIMAERSEKLGFDYERMYKIAVEAAEQCGRADIPKLREPTSLYAVLQEFSVMAIYVAEQGGDMSFRAPEDACGICIGPEGGWTPRELDEFDQAGVTKVGLGDFTLRAETAAIAALVKLQY